MIESAHFFHYLAEKTREHIVNTFTRGDMVVMGGAKMGNYDARPFHGIFVGAGKDASIIDGSTLMYSFKFKPVMARKLIASRSGFLSWAIPFNHKDAPGYTYQKGDNGVCGDRPVPAMWAIVDYGVAYARVGDPDFNCEFNFGPDHMVIKSMEGSKLDLQCSIEHLDANSLQMLGDALKRGLGRYVYKA